MSPTGVGPDRPYLQSQPSNLTQASQNSGQSQTPLRLKIFWQEDTIVMRFPPDIGFNELLEKVKARLKVENGSLHLRWEEVISGKKEDNALYPLYGDESLDEAIEKMGLNLRVFASATVSPEG